METVRQYLKGEVSPENPEIGVVRDIHFMNRIFGLALRSHGLYL